jgi:predicted dehydrogenase
MRFGVVGIDHLHLFELVQGLIDAGGDAVAHVSEGPLAGLYEGWLTESQARSRAEVLADPSIELIVTAAVPCERAAIAVEALRAGKHVLADKPGVTTAEQLAEVRAAIDETGGRWTVLFTERFENRAIAEAVRRAQAGAVGRVVHVIGAGPHTMWADRRPDWFWDPAATGGILVDIGSHQVDQFLAVTGATDVAVRTSMVGNVASPEHPAMEDIGSMTLVAAGPDGAVVGDHRLDYLTAAGLGTWGDVRLTIVGTEGTLEARANVDPAGVDGAEHLIQVDADGTRRIDCSVTEVGWARDLVADLADGGDRVMSQEHVLRVAEVCLAAQAAATGWGVR